MATGPNSDGDAPPAGTRQNEPPANRPSGWKAHPAGAETDGGRNTTAGTPSPTASASDAHDPEPRPEKQAEGEGDGASPAGHARPGSETHTDDVPPGTPAATT